MTFTKVKSISNYRFGKQCARERHKKIALNNKSLQILSSNVETGEIDKTAKSQNLTGGFAIF
jgi:hypothetical protein